MRKLARDFPNVGSVNKLIEDCCDLGQYANRVLGISERWSMARLVQEFVSHAKLFLQGIFEVYFEIFQLRTSINKDKAVRMSEWNQILSEQQQIYAAIDVYVSF